MLRTSTVAVMVLAVFGILVGPAVSASAQTCGPLNDGRVADVIYKDNAIFFDPIVRYEYTRAVLTISGPCEDIVRTFKPGEQIFFDLNEIKRTLDGRYTWQLRFTPAIDPEVADALQSARGSGEEDDVWWSFWQKGSIPDGPSVDSAGFAVIQGAIVDPGSGEESQKSAGLAPRSTGSSLGSATLATAPAAAQVGAEGAGGSGSGAATLAPKDYVINDDLIVDGSACIGFDCVNGYSFGFDTVVLRENNLRIFFDDTSTAASFPRNDWRIIANDSANGGGSYLGVEDSSAGRRVFSLEAGAPSHSLYVDDGGRVGFGTSTPSVELHTVDGDTPTLRLQQDGSSGFAPQTWDIAGNETSFFIRDATNGSTLPFRIRPGASSNALVIDADDDIGIGILSPSAPLHISRSGAVRYRLENTSAGTQWDANNDGNGDFAISLVGTGGNEFEIEQDGDIGNCGNPDHDFVLSSGSSCSTTPRSWIDAGSTSFSTSSSRSYKENLHPIAVPDILARIESVPVYQYDFINGPADRIGLMAEDFHQVFERGSDKELNGQEIQLALWLAVQQLAERTDELKSRGQQIEQLQARIEALEAARTED